MDDQPDDKPVFLFLDMDGVINNERRFRKRWMKGEKSNKVADPFNLALAATLIEELKARVVISSTWRRGGWMDRYYSWFARHGHAPIAQFIVGATPVRNDAKRGEEIREYVEAHDIDRDQILIIDDSSHDIADMWGDRFVQTSWEVGLQHRDCIEAMNLFSHRAD